MKLLIKFFIFCILFMSYYTISAQTHGTNQIITKTIFHDGNERTYHIHLPKDFDKSKPSPMVFALHGGSGRGIKFEKHTTNGSLSIEADKKGVVIVFPEGMNKQWNDGRKEIFGKKKSYDDVGFISKIIDVMIDDYNINSKKVYATGISNGGFMSVRLAIDLSNKIAAVAPVTAQLSKALKNKKSEQPISIMVVNGTKDPIVPYNGGKIKLFKFGRSRGEVLSTDETIKRFREFNKCSDTSIKEIIEDKFSNDKTTVEIESFSECTNNTEVVLIKVNGGGHTWPGGKQYLRPRRVGYVSKEINASELILDFLLKHSRE